MKEGTTMSHISDENRKRVVHEHIQDACTIVSLAVEYGIAILI